MNSSLSIRIRIHHLCDRDCAPNPRKMTVFCERLKGGLWGGLWGAVS